MKATIYGSHCSTYKCGVAGYAMKTVLGKHDYIEPIELCKSSNFAECIALLKVLEHYDQSSSEITIYTSSTSIISRFKKEIDFVLQSNYFRPAPWDKIAQLLRDKFYENYPKLVYSEAGKIAKSGMAKKVRDTNAKLRQQVIKKHTNE